MFRRGKERRAALDESRVSQLIAEIIPAGSGFVFTPQIGKNGVITVFVDANPGDGGQPAPNTKGQSTKDICRAVEARLKQEPGVNSVLAIARTGQTAQAAHTAQAAQAAHNGAGSHNHGGGGGGGSAGPNRIDGVANVIAVAAGKGGVGKSTVSLALALELSRRGKRVGVLDADFYGPSLPILLPNCPQPEIDDEKMLLPPQHGGITAMSIGFLLKEGAPLVWRGPMLIKTLRQLVREVRYGELDVLIVDMPPGTGDTALSLAQEVEVDGAIVVSTAEAMAVADAQRCAAMFDRFSIPLVGWVENMSWLACGECKAKTVLFAGDGFTAMTQNSTAPVIARLPFDVRTQSLRHDIRDLSALLTGDEPIGAEVRQMGEHVAAFMAQRASAQVN